MSIFICLIMGGLVGWIASTVLGTNARQGTILNVVLGTIGAVIGGWLVAPLLGAGSVSEGITIMNIILSLTGAGLLLAIAGDFRSFRSGGRGDRRKNLGSVEF